MIEVLSEAGESLPDSVVNARLFEHYTPYWQAFTILTQTRTSGFSAVNPISLQEISAYLDIYGITGIEERISYTVIIREVDNFYLKRENERLKRETERQISDRKHPKIKH